MIAALPPSPTRYHHPEVDSCHNREKMTLFVKGVKI